MKTKISARTQPEIKELRREATYLRRMAEHTIGRMLMIDAQSIAIRQELEQKRQGFSLMAELAMGLGWDLLDQDAFFVSICRRLNDALNMQRTAILVPVAESGLFVPYVLHGYSRDERQPLETRRLIVGPEFLTPFTPILITGADSPERLAVFREALKLPFLISVPVLLRDELLGLLVTGRLSEQRPFRPRLGRSDVETMQAVSAYLAAIVAWHRLGKAENLANKDPLTQLPNLRNIKNSLEQVVSQARRDHFKVAVLFIDLDGFKGINDTYGHAAGDMVLYTVAERLRGSVRESDLVGRLGGDEFLAVLTNFARPEDAALVAGKIIRKLSEPINSHGVLCQTGASIGIALFPDHGTEASDLLTAADEAMYLVKKGGKNAFLFAGSTLGGTPGT